MLKSEESNRKKLEDLEDWYEQAKITYLTEQDIMKEKDQKLIDRIKEVYEIDDDDFKIMSMPQYIFAKRFRTILQDLRLNLNQAEKLLKIRKETISKYKNGYEYPSIATILKITKKFNTFIAKSNAPSYQLNISPYYFLGLSRYMTLEVDEINRILGLSEKSMKILFMLQHNVPECEELTDNVEVSECNRVKLDIFNSFIEDNVNFLKFLTNLEFYATLKKEAKKVDNNKEDIKKQLLRHKRRVNKYVA